MKTPYCSLIVLVAGLAGCAGDDVDSTHPDSGDEIDSMGPYSSDERIEVGAEKELCFSARKDSEIIFRFESDQQLGFNFHYHVDGEMYYPVPVHTTRAEKGQYLVPKDDTYCLGWINIADMPATLSVQVEGADNPDWIHP